MKSSTLSLHSILSWLVALLVPVALVLAAVRLVLAPWFLEFEYRTPGFPDDPYGFTREERLHYSRIALDYLLNDADISFLGDQRFPEGQQVPERSCQYMDDCTYMYNQRELKHMHDVKVVVQAALRVWYVSLIGIFLLGVWGRVGGWSSAFLQGVRRGGWLTAILIGVIIVFVLLAFGVAFVAFHQVFFDPGTWMFLFSDTLIRLFPERFWRDTFLVVGSIAAGMGLLLGYLLRQPRASRSE